MLNISQKLSLTRLTIESGVIDNTITCKLVSHWTYIITKEVGRIEEGKQRVGWRDEMKEGVGWKWREGGLLQHSVG